MSASPGRLPLTVVGGFLGAGKTTLLNGWLRRLPHGQRLAVLVNDFGAVNIDAELVAARSADAIALTNGCVCCSIGDDLTAALIRVLETIPAFDGVVVEASGVSDPWKVAQLGLAEPGLALQNIVVVLDAGTALAHAGDPRLATTLLRQVMCADLLVINKPGLADAARAGAVRAWLQSLAPGTPVLETTDGTLPPLPQGNEHPPHPGPGGSARCWHACHDDHAQMFESFVLRTSGILSAAALRDALRKPPPGLLRLKGFLRTDEMGATEIQFAGRRAILQPAGPGRAGSALVAIGLRTELSQSVLEGWLRGAMPTL